MHVKLNGTSRHNARTLGRAARAVIRRRVRETRAIQRKQRIPDALIDARVSDFARRVRKVSPHWLSDARGLAEGAGLKPDDILMLNCLPPDLYPPTTNNCTSFVRVGKDQTLLFKIRDERNRVQTFAISKARKWPRYQAGYDLGNLGVAHVFNEHAVAGANNTGSRTDLVPDDPLLTDCHVLRYIAERATSVDAIPSLFECLLDAEVCGGAGPGRGAIFLFADPNRGLILECHSGGYAAEFVDDGLRVVANHFVTREGKTWESEPPGKNTLLREARMRQLLARRDNAPSPLDVFALSRDRKSRPHSLCNDDSHHFWMTISAQLQVIDREHPQQSTNYVCCGNTRHSVYLPVPLAADTNYRPLLDGSFYQCADSLYRQGRSAPRALRRRAVEKSGRQEPDYLETCAGAFDLLSSPNA